MAPAAAEVIYQHFVDFNTKPEDYDAIYTGDLGKVGKRSCFIYFVKMVMIFQEYMEIVELRFMKVKNKIPIQEVLGVHVAQLCWQQ